MAADVSRLAQVFVWKQGTAPDLAYVRQVLSAVNPEVGKVVEGENPPVHLFSIIGPWPDDPWRRALLDMHAIPAPDGTHWSDTTRYDLAGWQGTDMRSNDRIFVVTAYRRATQIPQTMFRSDMVSGPPAVAQVPYYPQHPTGPLVWPPQPQVYPQTPYAGSEIGIPYGYPYAYSPMVTGPLALTPAHDTAQVAPVTALVPVQNTGPLMNEAALMDSYAPYYVDLGPRLIAGVVDLIVVALIIGGLVGLLLANSSARVDSFTGWLSTYGSVVCLGLVIFGAYHVVLWSLWGQTLGKKLARVKVVRADGRAPGLGRALLRMLGYFFSLATATLGFIMLALDPRRQGLHDKIAQTYVVPEKRPERVPSGLPGYTRTWNAAPTGGQTGMSDQGAVPTLGMAAAAVAGLPPYGMIHIAPGPPTISQPVAVQPSSPAGTVPTGVAAQVSPSETAGAPNMEGSQVASAPREPEGGHVAEEKTQAIGQEAVRDAGPPESEPPFGMSGPVTEALLHHATRIGPGIQPDTAQARSLFKVGLAEMETNVRRGLRGYEVEPMAARVAANNFREALEIVPGSVIYGYFYAVALRYSEGFDVALGEFRRVLERDPSHYEARQQVAYGPRWHDAFAYPAWNGAAPMAPGAPLPEAIASLLPSGQQPATRLILLREGGNKVAAILSRTPRDAWAAPPTHDMPAHLHMMLSRTPFGPIVGLYVVVQDDPQNPYIGEAFLNPHDPGHPSFDACLLGQHLLEQLARQDLTYLIFVDGQNNLLLSRKLAFDAAAQVTMTRLLYEVQSLPPQVMDPQRFQQAAEWHMEHFSLDQIKP